MILSENQKKEFEKAVRPLMGYLSQYHPHVKVIVDNGRAEFLESSVSFMTEDYIPD